MVDFVFAFWLIEFDCRLLVTFDPFSYVWLSVDHFFKFAFSRFFVKIAKNRRLLEYTAHNLFDWASKRRNLSKDTYRKWSLDGPGELGKHATWPKKCKQRAGHCQWISAASSRISPKRTWSNHCGISLCMPSWILNVKLDVKLTAWTLSCLP